MKVGINLDLSRIWSRSIDLFRKFDISHFLLLYFAAHMFQIPFPSNGSLVFDEAYYVPASLKTLQGMDVNPAHPPLPKIIGALGIAAFGNNWFGWRFPQVIMQLVVLYLFYLIARRFLGNPWALGATMLLAFDTMFFFHGGLLLIDMPSFLFGFMAIELYFRRHYDWSAGSMGLAFLSREMAMFTFATLALYHVFVNRQSLKPALKIGLRYTLIGLLVFGSLFWIYDAAYRPAATTYITSHVYPTIIVGPGGTAVTTIFSTSQSTQQELITNPIQHLLYIVHVQSTLGLNASDEPYFHPLLWILPVDPFNSPTYYSISYITTSGGIRTQSIPIWYHAQENLPLWYGIWLAAAGVAFAFTRRKEMETAFFIAVGIASNYLPWAILDIIFRKIGFNYYMIYTLPFIALGLAFTFKMLRWGKALLALYALAGLAFFLWFFPVRPFA